VSAALYIDRSGCSWRQLPVDSPPWQTVYGWLRRWKARGFTERILEELREQIRIAEGREPEPSAGVIDTKQPRALRPWVPARAGTQGRCVGGWRVAGGARATGSSWYSYRLTAHG
jgi:transposase